MSATLNIVLFLVIFIYFVLLIRMIKRETLLFKYALLWFAIGCILLVLLIFPDALTKISKLLGFEMQMNALFTVAIGLLMLLALSITSIVSKHTEKIKNMVQYIAILEERVRKLENTVNTTEVEQPEYTKKEECIQNKNNTENINN